MSDTATSNSVQTLKSTGIFLRPIDRDGLLTFAEKGRNNPQSRGTNKVHTVMQGQYRSLSQVGQHSPVVVDEPLHCLVRTQPQRQVKLCSPV